MRGKEKVQGGLLKDRQVHRHVADVVNNLATAMLSDIRQDQAPKKDHLIRVRITPNTREGACTF